MATRCEREHVRSASIVLPSRHGSLVRQQTPSRRSRARTQHAPAQNAAFSPARCFARRGCCTDQLNPPPLQRRPAAGVVSTIRGGGAASLTWAFHRSVTHRSVGSHAAYAPTPVAGPAAPPSSGRSSSTPCRPPAAPSPAGPLWKVRRSRWTTSLRDPLCTFLLKTSESQASANSRQVQVHIDIRYIGASPREKLYQEMFFGSEEMAPMEQLSRGTPSTSVVAVAPAIPSVAAAV
jgi:hypothetical protein